MDDVDRAQEINEQFQAAVMAEQRHNRQHGPAATVCGDCGDDIPEKRRQAMPGCRRCIECQTLHENWRPV